MENKKNILDKTQDTTLSSGSKNTNSNTDFSSKTENVPRRFGYQSNYSNNRTSSGSRPFTQFNKQNKYYKRKKFCKLCAKGIEHVDYKDVDTLNKYLNYSLKISSRKLTGACSSHQRKISNAIKRARIVALIPFVKE